MQVIWTIYQEVIHLLAIDFVFSGYLGKEIWVISMDRNIEWSDDDNQFNLVWNFVYKF
jgi:hypothetical protein